jgi:hypothetical protein
MAVREPIYADYQVLGRTLNSTTIRAKERAMLKRVQEEYDVTVPGRIFGMIRDGFSFIHEF